MPLILAFDTAAAHCAAVLFDGTAVLAARAEAMDRGQAERLMPMLQEVLAEAGADWKALDGIGCGTGPGNFTGVRISVAAARGLALATGKPAVGVTRLEALALGLPLPSLVALDARRDESYVQRFGAGETAPALLAAGERPDLADLQAVTGDAAWLAETGLPITPMADPAGLAERIARIAAGRLATAPLPAPLYLRAADAAPPRDPPPRILP